MTAAFVAGALIDRAVRGIDDQSGPSGRAARSEGSDHPSPATDAGVRVVIDTNVDLLPDASLHLEVPAPPRP